MRRALLALTLVGAVVSGCGSGHFASPLDDDESPAPAERRPPSTGKSAEEVARAVNLKRSDFPYLPEVEQAERSTEDRKSDSEFEDCAGDQPNGFAEAQSPNFSGRLGDQYVEFSSSVEVFASAAAAAGAVETLRSRRAFACFKRLVEPEVEAGEADSEVEIIGMKTSRLRSPAPSLQGSFGYRITATVAPKPDANEFTAYHLGETPDGRPTFKIYLDALVFASDRMAVLFTATGGPHPVPGTLERNILELLDTRAKTESRELRY